VLGVYARSVQMSLMRVFRTLLASAGSGLENGLRVALLAGDQIDAVLGRSFYRSASSARISARDSPLPFSRVIFAE